MGKNNIADLSCKRKDEGKTAKRDKNAGKGNHPIGDICGGLRWFRTDKDSAFRYRQMIPPFLCVVVPPIATIGMGAYAWRHSGGRTTDSGSLVAAVVLGILTIVLGLVVASVSPFSTMTTKELQESVNRAKQSEDYRKYFDDMDAGSVTSLWGEWAPETMPRILRVLLLSFFALVLGLLFVLPLRNMLWRGANDGLVSMIVASVLSAAAAAIILGRTLLSAKTSGKEFAHCGFAILVMLLTVIPWMSGINGPVGFLVSWAIIALVWIAVCLIISDLDSYRRVAGLLDRLSLLYWKRELKKNHFDDTTISTVKDFASPSQWDIRVIDFLKKELDNHTEDKTFAAVAGFSTLTAAWGTVKSLTGSDEETSVEKARAAAQDVLDNLGTKDPAILKMVGESVKKVQDRIGQAHQERVWETLAMFLFIMICIVIAYEVRQYYWRKLSASLRANEEEDPGKDGDGETGTGQTNGSGQAKPSDQPIHRA